MSAETGFHSGPSFSHQLHQPTLGEIRVKMMASVSAATEDGEEGEQSTTKVEVGDMLVSGPVVESPSSGAMVSVRLKVYPGELNSVLYSNPIKL